MDDKRLASLLLAVPITAGRARRLFPGVNQTAIYAAAPHDGRGRFLSFGRALQIARECAVRDAQEAKAAIADPGRAADQEQARAAVAAPAVAHIAEAVEREVEALAGSLRARSASPRAVAMVEGIGAVNARQMSRARARFAREADNAPA